MTRDVSDVENGGLTVDEEGTELARTDAVAATAMRRLLDIARDAAGTPVHRADLTVRTGWLGDGAA